PTSTNTWTFITANKQINGRPRTGTSTNTSILDKWEPATVLAKVVVIPNDTDTSTQTTYIRNIRFYVE
ncbi:MAG TPA: hypothetical protein P5094_03085, partial [Patescibacteria group bacterium]|nr:hypothetical protein [Patescibacteria group bacterium]